MKRVPVPCDHGQFWPWAVGVVVVPSVVVDRRRLRELRLVVAVEAYKRGVFLVDVLSVSAEHAGVDVDEVRALVRRATAETVLVLDTCAGGHRLALAMPDGVSVCDVEAPASS